jgi:hypothetical protein
MIERVKRKGDLFEIENWDIQDSHNLIQFLKDSWYYKEFFIEEWSSDDKKKKPILILTLQTFGYSKNEEVIHALERNKPFWKMFWWKSKVGGRHYFKFDFTKLGFLMVSEYAKENNITRQAIYKSKLKYQWIDISCRKKLIRKKKNKSIV